MGITIGDPITQTSDATGIITTLDLTRMLLVYRRSSTTFARVITFNGLIPSFGVEQDVSANSMDTGTLVQLLNVNDSKVISVAIHTSSFFRFNTLSISGDTVTVGAATFKSAPQSSSGKGARACRLTDANFLFSFYFDDNPTTDVWRVSSFTLSGTTITFDDDLDLKTVTSGQSFANSSIRPLSSTLALAISSETVTSAASVLNGVQIDASNISSLTNGTIFTMDEGSAPAGLFEVGSTRMARKSATTTTIFYVDHGTTNLKGVDLTSSGFGTSVTIATDAAQEQNTVIATDYNTQYVLLYFASAETIRVLDNSLEQITSQTNENAMDDIRFINSSTDGGIVGPSPSDTNILGFSIDSNARFYQGAASLSEKFTLPFAKVAPKGFTLDTNLGTIVIGATENNDDPVVFSTNPYITGTVSDTDFPTTAPITVIKWI